MAAMSGLPDGFAIINKYGDILYWNPELEKITGLAAKQAENRPVWEIQAQLMPSAYSKERLVSLKKFWEAGRSTLIDLAESIETVFERPDGKITHVNLSYYKAQVSKKRSLICAVVKDLTKEKEKERFLENLESIRNHEIRSPLNAIVGFANLLLDDAEYGIKDEAAKFLKIIRDNGLRTYLTAESSLLLAKIERKDFALPKEEVNLQSLIAELSNNAQQIARTHSANIEILPDLGILTGKPLIFQGERTLLLSLLDNLLTNASSASAESNKNIVLTIHVNEKLTFIVRNAGNIPEELRPRLFQKYATFGKKKGNGLGLYIAKLITEAHGGELTYSTGSGETFFAAQMPLN